MRIAITGASGYIGSNIAKSLAHEHQIYPVSHETSLDSMIKTLGDNKIEAVIHLASLFIPEHKSEDVAPLIKGNIIFGSELLEAMRVVGVKKLINTGSSWQYYEKDGFSGSCLYGATKNAFEEIGKFYVSAYGISITNLILYDVYGPSDPRPKIIPHLLRLTRDPSGQSIDMSAGEQKIFFTHIDDIVRAYAISLSMLDQADPQFRSYFLRDKTSINLKQLVALIEEFSHQTLPISWGARPYREREIMTPFEQGDILPGWKPQISLRSGLKEIFDGGI